MKTVIVLIGFALFSSVVLASEHPTSSPNAIEGKWLVQKADAIVQIEPRGGNLIGRLVWVKDRDGIRGAERVDMKNPRPELRQRRVLGLVILTGLSSVPDKKGRYAGGSIYNPKTGMTMPVSMRLVTPDSLKVKVGGSALSQTTWWTRMDSKAVPPGGASLP